MHHRTALRGFIVLLAAIGILSGCGGGGETPQAQAPPPSGPVSVFAWAAPATFNDNTPLNPSPDGQSVVRSPVTQFTLELIPSIPGGNLLYVSMRAVGIDRQKSAFMAPVAWDRS